MRDTTHLFVKAAVLTALCGVLIGFVAGRATAAPLKVEATRLNLYDMLAVVIRTELKGPGVATIEADGYLRSPRSAGCCDQTRQVRLHRGLNRIARTLFVSRLEEVVQWLAPSPLRPNYRFVYRRLPLDAVRVEVRIGNRLAAARSVAATTTKEVAR